MTDHHGQWSNVSQLWNLLGPPLRPSRQDVQIISNITKKLFPDKSRQLKILILGVTPEFTEISLPNHSTFYAIDRSKEMIADVWNGDFCNAVCCDWSNIPWLGNSFDLVLCDGGFQLLSFPDSILTVTKHIERILKPDSAFICRFFCKSIPPCTPYQVIESIENGHIASANELKLRLGSALQVDHIKGVAFDDIWKFFQSINRPHEKIANDLGCSIEELNTINLYKNNFAKIRFYDQQFILNFIENNSSLSADQVVRGNYPHSAACPIVSFKKR